MASHTCCRSAFFFSFFSSNQKARKSPAHLDEAAGAVLVRCCQALELLQPQFGALPRAQRCSAPMSCSARAASIHTRASG